MRFRFCALLFFAIALSTLSACKTGYNKKPSDNNSVQAPECDTSPADDSANPEVVKVLTLLSNLTCAEGNEDGVIMGQSAGSGNQLVTEDHANHYDTLVDGINIDSVERRPALLSIDYEWDKDYSLEELEAANEKLTEHWNTGDAGLVSVSWRPLNPWVEDQDTATTDYTDEVNLEVLADRTSTFYIETWKPKLDKIADALADLQAQGVVVLWQPLPQMNSVMEDYWWGTEAIFNGTDNTNADLYTAIWKDMFEYFSNDLETPLNNLIWVYTTGEGTTLPATLTDAPTGAPIDWAYPGTDFVDVVAGVSFHNQLTIADYEAYLEFDKAFGMAGYGPALSGRYLPNIEDSSSSASSSSSVAGNFDNEAYAGRLKGSYKFTSFWISWHNLPVVDDAGQATGDIDYLSIVDNLNAKELTGNTYVYTLGRMDAKNLRN